MNFFPMRQKLMIVDEDVQQMRENNQTEKETQSEETYYCCSFCVGPS